MGIGIQDQFEQEDQVEEVLQRGKDCGVLVPRRVDFLLDDVGQEVGDDEGGDEALHVLVVVELKDLRLESEEPHGSHPLPPAAASRW